VQHQLRAFTPDDAKSLRATVSTYPTSGYDLEKVLQSLATGEAIVTVMNEKGAPSPVAWTRMRAPQGSMSPTPDAQIDATVAASPLLAKYGTAIDRDSAREMLARKLSAAADAEAARQAAADQAKTDADAAKAAAKAAADRAKAQKAADAEYNRLLKKTGGSTRSRAAKPQKTMLDEVLGSRTTQTILTSVVAGIFGTRRRR
jgi:DNA primase